MCLSVYFSSTAAIQWNSNLLCHHSFRGSSGSQSVLTFVNTSAIRAQLIHSSLKASLFDLFWLEMIEKHFANDGESAFTVKNCFLIRFIFIWFIFVSVIQCFSIQITCSSCLYNYVINILYCKCKLNCFIFTWLSLNKPCLYENVEHVIKCFY